MPGLYPQVFASTQHCVPPGIIGQYMALQVPVEPPAPGTVDVLPAAPLAPAALIGAVFEPLLSDPQPWIAARPTNATSNTPKLRMVKGLSPSSPVASRSSD